SPAFQSRARGRTVLVAAATVDNERQNQPSLPRLEMDAIIVPALKSRAKLTRSLPRPGKDGCVIFSNAINAGVPCERNPRVAQRRLKGAKNSQSQSSLRDWIIIHPVNRR